LRAWTCAVSATVTLDLGRTPSDRGKVNLRGRPPARGIQRVPSRPTITSLRIARRGTRS
jgi:hypothetical protein